jgi:hypothetical protein
VGPRSMRGKIFPSLSAGFASPAAAAGEGVALPSYALAARKGAASQLHTLFCAASGPDLIRAGRG